MNCRFYNDNRPQKFFPYFVSFIYSTLEFRALEQNIEIKKIFFVVSNMNRNSLETNKFVSFDVTVFPESFIQRFLFRNMCSKPF